MSKLTIKNRKAYHNYQIIDKFESGIVLFGTEIKSIREGKVDLSDGYCNIDENNQLMLMQTKISSYSFGNQFNHIVDRPRVLLMHKKEIIKLKKTVQKKGLTLVPLQFYFKKNYLKVLIGLAKGKKIFDKKKYEKQKTIALMKAQQS